ncbi:MAG TPA: hypothetical protein V6D25_13975 [Leptolyngbyaceae cyanobacterium]
MTAIATSLLIVADFGDWGDEGDEGVGEMWFDYAHQPGDRGE